MPKAGQKIVFRRIKGRIRPITVRAEFFEKSAKAASRAPKIAKSSSRFSKTAMRGGQKGFLFGAAAIGIADIISRMLGRE